MPKRAKKPDEQLIIDSIETTPDLASTRAYSPRTRGVRTGKGIQELWIMLFELNERLPAKKKMTDEEIKRQMWIEFPHAKGVHSLGKVGERGKHTVSLYRALYNNGKFTKGKKPKIRSNRYDEKGRRMIFEKGQRIDHLQASSIDDNT